MANSPGAEMQPFFFGTPDEPLFGCYHTPQAGSARGMGVVLCHPMGREYVRSHRTYRQMASRLCDAGFHVLRFDLYGCGDSSGDTEQGTIDRWLDDVSMATNEMRRRCGSDRVCLVGLRFGATLALLAASKQGNIDSLVLWDPIVNGTAYVEEMKVLHQKMLSGLNLEWDPHQRPTELLGYPVADSMLKDLENLDLLSIRQQPAHDILVIESVEKARTGSIVKHLVTVAPGTDYQRIPGPEIWTDVATALVPGQTVQAVVSWVSGVRA